jgi:uncharacterized protein (UPF0332 family)
VTPPPSAEIALARARQALAEARDNLRLGHRAVAVNRAYYAAFYASLALLSSIGVEPKTHEGVHSMIAQHFVRPGRLPPGTSRLLKHLEGDRELADYDLSTELTESEAKEAIADAETFVEQASRLL